MSAFSSRPAGYKAGMIALLCATCVYLVGFGAPYWASVEFVTGQYRGLDITSTLNEGMWMVCVSAKVSSVTATGCGNYGITGFPAWFHIVRALLGLCSLGLIIACLYALATNCCRTFPGPRTRCVEVVAGLSGLIGFASCMVYVGMRSGQNSSMMAAYRLLNLLNIDWTFNWAFYFATLGSAFSVIASIVVAVHNKPLDQLAHTGGMVMTTVTAQPGYAPQPYVGNVPQAYIAPSYAPAAKDGYSAPY